MGRLLRVGLTGGIGSGKSTVARLLGMMGAAVYVADDRAKALMADDAVLRRQIIDLLGPRAYAADGASLDRAFIASQVFGHPDKLAALGALVHPAVERDFLEWVLAQETAIPMPAYAVEEAAVLIESGAWRRMDCVVAVTAPEEVRIARVMRRDGVSAAAAKARIDAQLSDAERQRYAAYILSADERQLLIPQVAELHAVLCRLAARI